ncbi:Planctomycete cytochrome C [Roseimaritima multifibrata]|uniref:Planctomycete cytochrome C n=1 Tax=Roseimaritima multifibrata TaxID=1930274 RepID=A0A517MMM2_9BACT|nr:PSD1 and planctomycete cytochrome C domain-containing protein [Roseimaritima multifibrata]QDS96133.1 Planctomycete cytochrome C [Roseimaritima multifibrata]
MNAFAKILSLFTLVLLSAFAQGQESGVDLYVNEIKPLLKERCFACHGALKQDSGLRLDTAIAMSEHGILDDELISRLTSADDDYRMPPEAEALTPTQIDRIKKWLAAGAPAPEHEQAEADPTQHWAFQKIERPPLPAVDEANPIDAFLTAKQTANGLKPQQPAVRSLLLRRLYLDVTGLPPTTEQLLSEEPLDEILDSLLSSPQYGERWGRHWMDVWRYSDWYGLGAQLRNSQKHLWHWRDWIIESLNEDKGYDSMVREMLAGDELAPGDPKAVVATGFLARNYYLFNRTTWLDDTIEHTGKAFLGLTMNCAKCHDHKYDPISHEDYYRFRAVFEPHHVRLDALPGETNYAKNGLPRVYDDTLDAPTYLHLRGDPTQPDKDNPIPPGPPGFLANFVENPTSVELPVEAWAPGVRSYVQTDRLAQAEANVEQARKALAKIKLEAETKPAEKAADVVGKPLSDDFKKARPDIWETIGNGWRYQGGLLSQTQPTTDRTYLKSKANHPRDFDLTLKFQTTGGKRWKSTGIRFDVDGNDQNAHTVYASAVDDGSKVQLSHTLSGKTVYPRNAKADRAIQLHQEYSLNIQVREDLINVSLDGDFLFAYRLPQRRAGAIELFAFDAAADFYAIDVKPLPSDTVLKQTKVQPTAIDSEQALKLAQAQQTLAELELEALKASIAVDNALFKSGDSESSSAETLLEQSGRLQLQTQLAKAEVDLLKADAAKQAGATKRRDAAKAALAAGKLPEHVPLRGSERALNKKTDNVSQFAPVYPKTSTGRRTSLARWITHRDNPLTARVAVNHIWMRHFGTPLVDSVFDFGRRAPRPLHQDLLDYLAVELIESGWSMKHLHRMILTSKAWQRSSSNLAADPETLASDSENRYYWRMNNRRMESQAIRDSLLHLAGKLDPTLGGPPLPPAPSVRRRSLYLVHSREGRDKFLSTFDDADVLGCYRRSESIVPGQALAMMNSRDAIEAAGEIHSQFDTGLTDADFAQEAFLLILARPPSANEIEACLAFLAESKDRVRFIHALLNHNDFQVIR